MNKGFKRRLAWYIFKFLAFFAQNLPLKLLELIAFVVGRLGYIFAVNHRRTAFNSLDIAFPKLNRAAKIKIVKSYMVTVILGAIELLYYLRRPKYLAFDFSIFGRQHIDQALTDNKGVIIMTAHLGNFPLMARYLVHLGYKVNVILRPLRDPIANKYLNQLMLGHQVVPIFSYPRRECIEQTISALRRNELVVILVDQNFGTGGVWVKFFDKLAATPVGHIVFALRTQAKIIPAYIERLSLRQHQVNVFSVQELKRCENKQQTLLENTIMLTRIIENWVKEKPQLWGWIHKRWKSQPNQEILNSEFMVER